MAEDPATYRPGHFSWAVLALYFLSVLGFLGMAGYILLHEENAGGLGLLVGATLMGAVTQLVLIAGCGTRPLSGPTVRRGLVLPVASAGLMMSALCGSLFAAFAELFRLQSAGWYHAVLVSCVALAWLAWGGIYYYGCARTTRFAALVKLLVPPLVIGILAVCLISGLYRVVSHRPDVAAGETTLIAGLAAAYVLLWATGPLIVALLFLLPVYLSERRGERMARRD